MNTPAYKKFLPLILLIALLAIAFIVIKNPPAQPSRGDDRRPQMAVEVLTITPRPYTVVINSYGRVQPATQSLVVAQVAGQVVKVADNFDSGSYFAAGDVLLAIDDRDYVANVKVAEAALLDARKVLVEEQARSKLALDDWRRSGRAGEPDDLVLRKPQLLAARAGLISSQANLARAKNDLERTVIKAPFAGRVLSRDVDLGQVVAVNQRLGEIYATDAVEIRLPLRNRDLRFIDLPESYNGTIANSAVYPAATIHSNLVAGQSWPARVTRTEAAIDSESRQLHVVAEIDQPFAAQAMPNANVSDSATSAPQIKIGQYVTAQINGKTLDDALVVPVDSIYQGSFVYVVEQGTVRRREISIAWLNERDAIVSAGVQAGAQLVITPLGQVVSGTPVQVVGAESPVGPAARPAAGSVSIPKSAVTPASVPVLGGTP